MLRHIYLTDKLGSIPRLNELKELAKQMGHSIEEQQQYILHNDDVEADTEEDDWLITYDNNDFLFFLPELNIPSISIIVCCIMGFISKFMK